jgi:hypothetical protein
VQALPLMPKTNAPENGAFVFLYYSILIMQQEYDNTILLPNGIPIKGLRRNDDAMKNLSWYLNIICFYSLLLYRITSQYSFP